MEPIPTTERKHGPLYFPCIYIFYLFYQSDELVFDIAIILVQCTCIKDKVWSISVTSIIHKTIISGKFSYTAISNWLIFLCTWASLYAPYSLLLISNKFWMGECRVGRLWGRSEGAESEGRIRTVEGENKRGGAGWLSFLMHLSGQSRVVKFLYSSAPPPPTVWDL